MDQSVLVYGNPYRAEKREFWDWLSGQPMEDPWFCGGDMNEFMWDHENSCGQDDLHTHPCLLHEFMSKIELLDLGLCGPQYTWKGTRNNSLV